MTPSAMGTSQAAAALPAGFGVNLFGPLDSATGLGVTVRHTARALHAAGVPFCAYDTGRYYETSEVNDELGDIASYIVRDASALPHPVNLYSLPIVSFPALLESLPPALCAGRFHAGIVWWETTRLHPACVPALARMDALVGFSGFITGVLANSLPLTPALRGKQALFMPDDVRPERARFGLPATATIFVSSFDPSSDPARKFPGALITAFRQAFPDPAANVRLVLRLNNADATDMARATVQQLRQQTGNDPRIGFLLAPLSYRDVLSFYASADVFVSLHRAEGLGLGLLESMRLGIPVIATGWSGNMSFMSPRDSALVRYQLIRVCGNHPFYRPEELGNDALWAEPALADAVAWMQRLHADPVARRALGVAARAAAETYQQRALRLDWLHELAALWTQRQHLPRVHGKLGERAVRT